MTAPAPRRPSLRAAALAVTAAGSGAAAGAAITLLVPVSNTYTVERAVDGDTVRVADLTDGQLLLWAERGPQSVRLLCISAAERGAPGSAEAAAFMAQQTEGRRVVLEPAAGPGAQRRDGFGRILATVRGLAGEDPALELVRQGLARIHRGYPCAAARLAELSVAENEARAAHRGLWK